MLLGIGFFWLIMFVGVKVSGECFVGICVEGDVFL